MPEPRNRNKLFPCNYTNVRISMDGKGRWMDNVMIERLWRSLKYENVYLNAYETVSEARIGIGKWISYYNSTRPHSSLDGLTPEEVSIENSLTRNGKNWRHENQQKFHLIFAAKLSNDWGPPLSSLIASQ